MRYLLMCLLAVAVGMPAICQITGVEYYIDTDPGYRNATSVAATTGNDITKSFTIPFASITNGFHTIGIRAKDAQGHWSLTQLHNFYVVAPTVATSIASTEYYIDTDPGYGKAKAVSTTIGADSSLKFVVPLTSFINGYHTIGIRSKDAQGRWSLTQLHSFYVVAPIVATSIAATEYYVDTDPGYGKAKAVSTTIGADSSLKFVVPLTTYSAGFHTLDIRSRDNAGRWSETNMHVFYINADKEIVNITSIKYYFTGTGATDSVYTYTVPQPSTNVDLNFTANLSQLQGNSAYDMHIIAIGSEGSQSEEVIKHITVCNGDPAKAKFNYVIQGTQVSFTNNSVAANNFTWSYGDGTTDTIKNPFHTYNDVAVYPVKLIASNACNSDTTTDSINIAGIKSIYSNIGGNSGNVTVDIRGAGFDSSTKVYLHKDGQTDILSDTIPFIQNSGLLTTTFDLTNKTIGLWDVIAMFSNGKRDTLYNAFTIQNGTDSKLWVNITGDYVLRIGFNQIYTVTYGNDGNTDATVVPLVISGLPIGTDIQLLQPLYILDSLHTHDSVYYKWDSTQSYTVIDSNENMSLRFLYIGKIPAHSLSTLSFIFHVPTTTQLHSYPTIEVQLGKPLFFNNTNITNKLSIEEENPSISNCTISLLKEARSLVFDQLLSADKWAECLGGAAKAIIDNYSELKEFAEKPHHSVAGTLSFGIGEFGDVNKSTIATAITCAEAGGLTTAGEVPKLAFAAAGLAFDALRNAGYIADCAGTYVEAAKTKFFPIIGNAWDPNSKYGSGDSSSKHYVDSIPLTYSINFENKPTANLNAQTVTVVDTLNKSYYNYSSFGFTSVSLGDSIYLLSSPATSFIHDFDFTTQYGVKARVTATFDTITGIAQWKFLSIDPTTNQATTNALAGFLPPDVNSPQGQGYVSFVVRQNPNLKTGDTAHNKATIVFDYNPAITTNSWQNVFDFVAPSSKVAPLPAEENDTTFIVQWSGFDNLSGIRSYDVYYSMNGKAYQLWLSGISATDSNFTGKYDSTYSFYSIATDNAGNVEPPKTTAEATTHVTSGVLAAKSSPLAGTLNQNHTVSLSWKTYTELNNKGFYIERNTGNGWQTIGFVKGTSNSTSTQQYLFIDSDVINGKIYYYRYKQVDNDGHSTYSNEIVIELINGSGNLLSMTTTPNPFKDQTVITYTLPVSGHALLRLFDYHGGSVSTITDAEMSAGNHTRIFDRAAGLANGVYILRLETKAGVITNKVVIVK